MVIKAQHESQAQTFARKMFFEGSGEVVKGQGLCFNRTYGTAAAQDGRRDNNVNLPSATTNRWFAGVVEQAKPAKSGGQWVTVNEPDSVCEVATLIATTIGVTRLTCLAGVGAPGMFAQAGFRGRGSVTALHTLAAVTGPTDYSVAPISSSLDGSASIGAADKTLTSTNSFTNVPVTANLKGNEYVWIVAGTLTSGGTTPVTYGRYRIVSKTSDSIVVLDSSPCAGASNVAFYCVRGAPAVLAKLELGDESGLTEWVTPDSAFDAVGVGANSAMMVGGTSFIFGGFTLTTSHTDVLGDGTYVGQRKRIRMMGALTTGDFIVEDLDAGNNMEQLDGATDLATMTFDAAAEDSTLEWGGVKWRLIHNAGTALA